ncbi:hypothetical protein JHD48_09625 [Sulfurimonas sp. SAG-AH-194-I05]|nr:MqnA/MqnD/SBP family protein [Sulfurimonas sp. SAG-AH-194-I05]MDF1875994.1 hypothetical protein [Sulfurimonas sp. SAG-AH-194-I05]
MVFGKIQYVNLLPFHVFMKRFTRSSQQSASMQYYSGVPSHINKKFRARRVDAAFISSSSAKKYKNVNIGIIATKEVQSVLVIPHATDENDQESASSNVLAKLLHIKGKVIIGDKALKHALQTTDYKDLAKEWQNKYKVPFVFALLCYHGEKKIYKEIEKKFLQKKVKIPSYLLQKAALQTGVSPRNILKYLELISYKLDKKAKKGLKKFYVLRARHAL